MPDLPRDAFLDTMTKAVSLSEASMEFDQHHPHNLLYYGQPYAPMHKVARERQGFLGTPTFPMDLPETFVDVHSRFLSSGCDQHMVEYSPEVKQPSTYPLQIQSLEQQVTNGALQLPPIQQVDHEALQLSEMDCTWIDVLDALPAISQYMSPFPSPVNVCVDSSRTEDYSSSAVARSLDSAATVARNSAARDKSFDTNPRSRASIAKAPRADDATTAVSSPLRPSKKRGAASKKAADKSVNNHVEQFEHVRRERQRREDMSFRISTLECLLPSSPNLKRDRASIVHDSVNYVKSLQQQVEDLKRALLDLQQLRSSKQAAAAQKSDRVKMVMDPDRKPSTRHAGATSSEMDNSNCPEKRRLVEYHIQVEGGEAAFLRKCSCRSDYMSSVMRVLEQLNLDLCRCTVTKMFDYTVCVIFAKPRLTSNPSAAASSSSVVAKLRSIVEM